MKPLENLIEYKILNAEEFILVKGGLLDLAWDCSKKYDIDQGDSTDCSKKYDVDSTSDDIA